MYSPVALFTLFFALFATLVAGAPVTPNETSLTKRYSNERMTWYQVGLGACGHTNTADQHVVALSSSLYGSGGDCGKKLTISYGGKSTTATVVDRCTGCPEYGLDLSEGLFKFFAPTSKGVIQGSWHFD